LQEEEVRRVGELSAKKVDLRVVAATNKDLSEEVRAGRFREDLYYRLNVINLKMPPLRERPEDIPILANLFLRQAVEKNGLGPKKISSAAARLLMEQKWSGNVRALRNVIEQSAIMSDGENIAPEDFPFAPPAPSGPAPLAAAGFRLSLPEEWLDLKAALREVTEAAERQIIARALKAHGGNRTHAAAALGLSRRALITKIQAYNL
jgi:DNA-binding NtrC family response regulator